MVFRKAEVVGTGRGGIASFVTWAATADGRHFTTSRRFRKHLPAHQFDVPLEHPLEHEGRKRNRWDRLWAPSRLGWWIAVLFMIGSALFALGGAAATWPGDSATHWIGSSLLDWFFFAGSVFFTSAAYLQYLEALNNDVGADILNDTDHWRFWGWSGRNLGFLAAVVQLAGTLLFNFNTGDALIAGLTAAEQDLLIWTPDMVGSICFLVSSQLAVMEFSHHWWSFVPKALAWWIVALNLLGSVLFQMSAISSFVGMAGDAWSPWLANFGTFSGAVCFLIGAYLLIPELFEADVSDESSAR